MTGRHGLRTKVLGRRNHRGPRPAVGRSKGSGRRRPRLRLVRPRGRKRFPFFVAAFLVVGLCIFGVVILQTLVSQSSFQMQQLSNENAVLQESHGRLELEVAQLSAPERIASEARRLGLRLPDNVQTITVGGTPSGNGSGAQAPSGGQAPSGAGSP